MAFTTEEEARILHHLGYPDWVSLAQSIQLGYPAATQPLFLVRDSWNRLTPGGEASVRRDLCECEAIERQMSEARSRFRATRVGEITLNHAETSMLRTEYKVWQQRLADDLGVVVNPYSQQAYQGMPGGIGAKVVG